MIKSALPVIFISFILFFHLSDNAFAAALENHAVGIRATTLACSFTGLADDAGAIYHNPAGLAFHEQGYWYGETYVLSGISKTEYSSGGSKERSDTDFHIPGSLIAKTFDKWAFGMGYYVCFAGGGVEYDNFQNSGSDLEAYLGLAPLTTAVAYKVTPKLSLGANFSIYTGYMGSKSLQEIAPGTFAEVETEYEGYSGFGYSFGLMYKPTDTISIGAMFRPEFDVEMEGDSTIAGIKYDSEVDYTMPLMFSLGIGYTPSPDLIFSLSWTHIPWGDLDQMDITTNGVTQISEQHYRHGFIIGLGVEYILNDEFTLRTGFVYGECATQDDGISPLAPDSTKWQPSLGIGWHINNTFELSTALIPCLGRPETNETSKLDHDTFMLMSGVNYKF